MCNASYCRTEHLACQPACTVQLCQSHFSSFWQVHMQRCYVEDMHTDRDLNGTGPANQSSMLPMIDTRNLTVIDMLVGVIRRAPLAYVVDTLESDLYSYRSYTTYTHDARQSGCPALLQLGCTEQGVTVCWLEHSYDDKRRLLRSVTCCNVA